MLLSIVRILYIIYFVVAYFELHVVNCRFIFRFLFWIASSELHALSWRCIIILELHIYVCVHPCIVLTIRAFLLQLLKHQVYWREKKGIKLTMNNILNVNLASMCRFVLVRVYICENRRDGSIKSCDLRFDEDWFWFFFLCRPYHFRNFVECFLPLWFKGVVIFCVCFVWNLFIWWKLMGLLFE